MSSSGSAQRGFGGRPTAQRLATGTHGRDVRRGGLQSGCAQFHARRTGRDANRAGNPGPRHFRFHHVPGRRASSTRSSRTTTSSFPTITRASFHQLFTDRQPADEPTIYVAVHSKADPDRAPPGGENWFVLVNAPALTADCRVDWPAHRARSYGDRIIDRLETRFGLRGFA